MKMVVTTRMVKMKGKVKMKMAMMAMVVVTTRMVKIKMNMSLKVAMKREVKGLRRCEEKLKKPQGPTQCSGSTSSGDVEGGPHQIGDRSGGSPFIILESSMPLGSTLRAKSTKTERRSSRLESCRPKRRRICTERRRVPREEGGEGRGEQRMKQHFGPPLGDGEERHVEHERVKRIEGNRRESKGRRPRKHSGRRRHWRACTTPRADLDDG